MKKVNQPEATYLHQKDEALINANKELAFQNGEIEKRVAELIISKEAIEASEENYRLLFNSTADAIFIHNRFGKILSANQSACNEYGYSIEEFLLLSAQDIDIPEQRINIDDRISKLMKHGFVAFESIHQRKDKTKIHVDVNSRKIVFKGQDAVISVCRNINKRKHAEEALKNSLSLTEAALESIHSGILIVDLQGAVIRTNANFAEMWHIPSSVITLGKDKILVDHILEQLADPDSFIDKVSELYGKPETESFDLIHFKDGRIFERISKPMWKGGKPIGRVWSFLDITERKKSEEAIKLLFEELISANNDKDRFITILAHDLRSPFNGLLGVSELLSKNIREYDIDQIESLVSNINISARNSYNLLMELLMWAQSQSGKLPYEPQKLCFSSICIEVLETLNPIAKEKSIAVNHNVEEELTIFADVNMLKTVLRNLISNAIKFTNSGGKISIYAEQTGAGITITVLDNGIGIPPEIQNKLFDISQYHSSAGTADEKGSGLGLLLCNEFIKKHGGEIWVVSELGKGSEFKFTLPNRN